MTYRVLVTGARIWEDRDWLEIILDQVVREQEDVTLVSGACPTGADRMAEEWAEKRGHTIERHPADWEQYGKDAGPMRNQKMVDLGANVVVAFPRGVSRGTRHTIERAMLAKLTVLTVEGTT